MFAANPLAQHLLQTNPQLGAAMQSPEFFRQMANPQTIQSVLQMYGGAGGAGAPPGTPGQTPAQPTPGTSGTGTAQQGAAAANPFLNMDFSQLFAGQPGTAGTTPPNVPAPGTASTGTAPTGTPSATPGTAPAANPYGVPPMWGFPVFPGMVGGMAGGMAPPVAEPEQRFAVQLQQLNEMGFTNRQVNIQALLQTNGNVEFAIERMLNGI